MQKGPPDNRQVLTAYCPVASASRWRLEDDDEILELTDRAVDDISSFIPGLRSSLEGIEVFVRGHALPIPYPGFMANVVRRLQVSNGPVVFANTDLYGVPAVETALWSGIEAARHVS